MKNLHIKYFGEVAEKTGKSSELLELQEPSISHLIEHLKLEYRLNSSIIKIAINQELVTDDQQSLSQDDEIAVLSPFAGG